MSAATDTAGKSVHDRQLVLPCRDRLERHRQFLAVQRHIDELRRTVEGGFGTLRTDDALGRHLLRLRTVALDHENEPLRRHLLPGSVSLQLRHDRLQESRTCGEAEGFQSIAAAEKHGSISVKGYEAL